MKGKTDFLKKILYKFLGMIFDIFENFSKWYRITSENFGVVLDNFEKILELSSTTLKSYWRFVKIF